MTDPILEVSETTEKNNKILNIKRIYEFLRFGIVNGIFRRKKTHMNKRTGKTESQPFETGTFRTKNRQVPMKKRSENLSETHSSFEFHKKQ